MITKQDIQQMERDLKKQERALQKAKEKFRKECRHPNSKYYPDPSGNNDDGWYCDDCESWT